MRSMVEGVVTGGDRSMEAAKFSSPYIDTQR